MAADRPVYRREVAIVCGESTYGSLAELYAEKKGLRPPMADNATLRRGRWVEAGVFDAMAEELPEWQIRRAKIHVRDIERRLACTPDGFATAPGQNGIGIVQAKVVARSVFRQRWLDDPGDDIDHGEVSPPVGYRLQVLTEILLNEVQWGVLAVLINGEFGCSFRVFFIERDAVLEALIYDRTAVFFRDYFDPGIMPPFEPQRDERLVRLLYPKDDGTEIDLTLDNRALEAVEELTEAQAASKRIGKLESALKAETDRQAGAHVRLADGRLSWKLFFPQSYVAPATRRAAISRAKAARNERLGRSLQRVDPPRRHRRRDRARRAGKFRSACHRCLGALQIARALRRI
jgi:hypothetical protein